MYDLFATSPLLVTNVTRRYTFTHIQILWSFRVKSSIKVGDTPEQISLGSGVPLAKTSVMCVSILNAYTSMTCRILRVKYWYTRLFLCRMFIVCGKNTTGCINSWNRWHAKKHANKVGIWYKSEGKHTKLYSYTCFTLQMYSSVPNRWFCIFTLTFNIIPTLFAYFLPCHPYISLQNHSTCHFCFTGENCMCHKCLFCQKWFKSVVRHIWLNRYMCSYGNWVHKCVKNGNIW